jgi:hypothetical protein
MTESHPAIDGLARDLDAVRHTVDGLAALPVQVEELAGIVASLTERIAAAPGPRPGAVPTWLSLPTEAGEHTAAAVLSDLIGWLGAVYLRYSDAVGLPECWLWHPDVVEELLWLRHCHAAAYTGPDASVAAAGDWHDRSRPGVVHRIKATVGTCSAECHQTDGEHHRPARLVPGADATDLITAWWSGDRAAVAPEPAAQERRRKRTA